MVLKIQLNELVYKLKYVKFEFSLFDIVLKWKVIKVMFIRKIDLNP